MRTNVIFGILIAIAVTGVFFYHERAEAPGGGSGSDTETTHEVTTLVEYICEGGKALMASYGEEIVTVDLVDGRALTLAQTVSASGVRYANEGESVVFWSKGDTAFLEEGGETTYGDCMSADAALRTYRNRDVGISFSYDPLYYLFEREAGTPERPQTAVALLEDTEENRAMIDGTTTESREGPTAITVDIYENTGGLSPLAWAEQDTNWNIGTKKTEPAAVGGESGVSFLWDGLYQGKSIIIVKGPKVYVFSVTWLTPEDRIRVDFDALLASVRFE